MTGTLKARVTGDWVPILGSGQEAANTARYNSAWGQVANSIMISGVGGIGTSQTTVLTTTFTAVANRLYEITADLMVSKGAGDTSHMVYVFIMDNGSQIMQRDIWVQASSDESFHAATTVVASAGTHTITVRVQTAAGVCSVYGNVLYPSWVAVRDVGPQTPVSIAPPSAAPRVVASGNALGIVGMGALQTPNPVIAQNTFGNVTLPLVVRMEVGRRYRVALSIRAANMTAAGGFETRISDYSTTSVEKWNYYGGAYQAIYEEWVYDGDGGTHSFTVQVRGAASAITVYTDYSGAFYCEDLGPNMSPALPIPETYQSWTPLTLQNSWVSNGSDGVPAYRKVGDLVYLRGAVSGGADGSICTTLPVGFRPPVLIQAVAYGWITKRETIHVQVTTSGTVVLAGMSATPAQNVTLSQVSFSTTA